VSGVAVLAAAGAMILTNNSAASAALPIPVWAEQSMVRVFPTDAPKSTTTATLSAARNEIESFQVVASGGASGLTNVNLALSDLVGPGGAVIGKAQLTPYREHYVNVNVSSPNYNGTNNPGGTGLYPDALIPFTDPSTGAALNGSLKAAGVSIAPSKNQPYWVDVKVPASAPAGTYTGNVTVSSNEGSSQVGVSLNVMDFTLPSKPALKSSFLDWSNNPNIAKQLLDNKLSPAWADGQAASFASNYGMNSTNMAYWSGADNSTCSMSAPPSASSLQTTANNLRQPGVHLYNYTADEIDSCPGLTTTLQSWARALHGVGAKQLVTMAPVSSLFSDGAGGFGVDDWVVLPWMYDKNPTLAQDAINRGMEVWSYNTLTQDSYSPKWLIDFKPMDFRIQPGMINQSLRMTGLLYWKVNSATSDPWNNVNTYQGGFPGDGMLVYPGAQVGMTGGAAPSMRLKWLRDGVEDYDYVELAKQAGKGAEALAITRSVGKDWHTWTRDVAALNNARMQLAALLGGTTSTAPAPAPTATATPAPTASPVPTATPSPTATATTGTTDTTAPSAPTNLRATSTSTSSLSLAWDAATDNVGVAKYAVWRGDANKANWVLAGTTTGGTRTFTDSGRVAGTTYSYAVYAYDAAGNRSAAASNILLAATSSAADTTAPSAPTGLKVTGRTSSSVSLAWTRATDNVAVAKYVVWRADRYGTWTQVGSTTGTTFANTGLASKSKYTYAVYAYDAAGNRSAGTSNKVTVTTY
jgi:chitodextrinase